MTDMPARTFRLSDRGQLAPGYFADLVVLDPQAIIDRVTYDDPRRPSLGIDKVFVNGERSFAADAGVVGRTGWLVGGNTSEASAVHG